MAGITVMRDGVIIGSLAMGRFQDLVDAPVYVANKFLVVNAAGTGLAMSGVAPADVVFGDLEFSDLTCEKCKRPFEEGEELTLIVVAAGPEKIRTRPVHRFCTEVHNG